MDTITAPAVRSAAQGMPLRLPVAAIAATIVVALLLVFTQQTRETTVSAPKDRSNALASRDVRFEDQADGSIRVIDARLGSQIELVAPASNGFLRGALRGLVRERKRQGIGIETPFTVAILADGRLLIHDNATGHEIDLASFGSTNAAVFSRLLAAPGEKP
jgi:putative photosynthetic complex assembly protein